MRLFKLSLCQLKYPYTKGLPMDDQSDLNSPKTIAIGSKLELLIDDYLIDSMKDVSFVLHQPVPREVAIVHDATWEGGACA